MNEPDLCAVRELLANAIDALENGGYAEQGEMARRIREALAGGPTEGPPDGTAPERAPPFDERLVELLEDARQYIDGDSDFEKDGPALIDRLDSWLSHMAATNGTAPPCRLCSAPMTTCWGCRTCGETTVDDGTAPERGETEREAVVRYLRERAEDEKVKRLHESTEPRTKWLDAILAIKDIAQDIEAGEHIDTTRPPDGMPGEHATGLTHGAHEALEEAFAAWYDAACSEDYGTRSRLIDEAGALQKRALGMLMPENNPPAAPPTVPGELPTELLEWVRWEIWRHNADHGLDHVLDRIDGVVAQRVYGDAAPPTPPRPPVERDESKPPPGWKWFLHSDGSVSDAHVCRIDGFAGGRTLRQAWAQYDAEHSAARPPVDEAAVRADERRTEQDIAARFAPPSTAATRLATGRGRKNAEHTARPSPHACTSWTTDE